MCNRPAVNKVEWDACDDSKPLIGDTHYKKKMKKSVKQNGKNESKKPINNEVIKNVMLIVNNNGIKLAVKAWYVGYCIVMVSPHVCYLRKNRTVGCVGQKVASSSLVQHSWNID